MERRILRTITALAIVIPLIILWWSLPIGAVTLFLGSAVALQTMRQLRTLQRADGDEPHQQRREDQAAVVFVSLIGPDGAPLPADAAQDRLEAARFEAGPRAQVVGVYRPVEPAQETRAAAAQPGRRWGIATAVALVAVLGWGVGVQGWRPAWMGPPPLPPPPAGWATMASAQVHVQLPAKYHAVGLPDELSGLVDRIDDAPGAQREQLAAFAANRDKIAFLAFDKTWSGGGCPPGLVVWRGGLVGGGHAIDQSDVDAAASALQRSMKNVKVVVREQRVVTVRNEARARIVLEVLSCQTAMIDIIARDGQIWYAQYIAPSAHFDELRPLFEQSAATLVLDVTGLPAPAPTTPPSQASMR